MGSFLSLLDTSRVGITKDQLLLIAISRTLGAIFDASLAGWSAKVTLQVGEFQRVEPTISTRSTDLDSTRAAQVTIFTGSTNVRHYNSEVPEAWYIRDYNA